MELRHFHYFLAVAEELNFTKAAEKLCISQPPLSRQIKELEGELKARLFDRNNKRVVLTEAGKYFEKEIRVLVQSLEKISLQTQKIADNISGEFRIGYISSTYSSTISDLLSYLIQTYPQVHVKLYEVPTQQQIVDLEQGKIDLGILRAPILSPRIESDVWFKDGYALVYHTESLKIESEEDIERLSQETFVFFNRTYAPHYYESLLEICARYGFTPNVVHESNNIGSIIQLVRNGLGVSIVPASVARIHTYPEIAYWELTKVELHTQVLLARPKGEDSLITQSAIDFLMK